MSIARVFVASLVLALGLGPALADDTVPPYLAVAGELQDNAGRPVTGLVDLTFALYAVETGGTALWTETQPRVAVTAGRLHAYLGVERPFNPDLLDGGERWLAIKIGAGPEMQPRQRLASLPFALRAAVCSEIDGHTVEDFLLVGDPIPADAIDGAVPLCANADMLGGSVTAADLAALDETQEIADAIASLGPPVDSIDGLTGGTIAGDVDVAGDLAVTGSLTAGGRDVCDTSGNCGPMLNALSCTSGQVLMADGPNSWTCGTFPTLPDGPCTGPGAILQWDGTRFECTTLAESGLSGGNANGYELVDSWDFAWDGLLRAERPWAEADATCRALGGRLPTPSELYRVSNRYGTGEVADLSEQNHLWTLIAHDEERFVTLRLDTGETGQELGTARKPYRCVWPTTEETAFAGTACFTVNPDEDGCWTLPGHGEAFRLDAYDRPALNHNAATRECAFYHAHLASQAVLAEAIRGGLPNGSNVYLHTSERLRTGDADLVVGLARWQETFPEYTDLPDDADEGPANAATKRPFRCAGIGRSVPVHPVTLPDEWVADTTYLKSTSNDESSTEGPLAVDFASAVSYCRDRGGHLPTTHELVELIQAGLPNGSGEWLWTSDQLFGDSVAIVRWTDVALNFTGFQASGGVSQSSKAGTEARRFRCVYHPIQTGYTGPAADACNPTCWTHSVSLGVDVRLWTDSFDRSSLGFVLAQDLCRERGGRLPSERDLIELVRAGLPNGFGWAVRLWTTDLTGESQVSTVSWQGQPATGYTDAEGNESADRDRSAEFSFRCLWTNELRLP